MQKIGNLKGNRRNTKQTNNETLLGYLRYRYLDIGT